MEGAGGGEGSTGAVTGQQALHVEHAVPVNKLLLTVGYVTGVVSGIGFIVSLTVAPMAALGSLATSAASLVLLQLAAPKRSPHAVGPSRWMGAAAAAHVTALVWSLVILNALGAMRYYSGVETVAWFQFGMDDDDIAEARACGQGWVTLSPKCSGESPIASFLAYPTFLFVHISGAIVALGTGIFQVWKWLRTRALSAHRWTGRVYALGVTCGSVGAVGLALHTTSGVVGAVGFLALALCWQVSLVVAVRKVLISDVSLHREWMLRNYALTLAAVTLRVHLPLLQLFGMSFAAAYAAVSWSSWVPNVILAELFIRATRKSSATSYSTKLLSAA